MNTCKSTRLEILAKSIQNIKPKLRLDLLPAYSTGKSHIRVKTDPDFLNLADQTVVSYLESLDLKVQDSWLPGLYLITEPYNTSLNSITIRLINNVKEWEKYNAPTC